MNGEDSLFDVPPAAFGRYKVLQQLGAGTTGLIFRGEDTQTHAPVVIKVLRMDLPPKRAGEVAHGLAQLVERLPSHPALAAPLASGLDELGPYLVSAFTPGDSLDVALRDYGPAVIEDLVPRLRLLAEALDAAAHAGFVHGSLHPRDIVVSSDATRLGGVGVAPLLARAGVAIPRRRPYMAPEIAGGSDPTAAADQFALAALTFEWLFGRRVSGPAESRIDVPALPGVDRDALAGAFTTALAPEPGARFESCEAFADGVSASVIGVQAPVVSKPPEPELELEKAGDTPFEWPAPAIAEAPDVERMADAPPASLAPESIPLTRSEPSPVAWQSTALAAKQPERFGGGVLILTLIVGLVFGFAAGYMARPRALQHPVLAQPVPQADVAAAPAVAAPPAAASPAAPGEPPRNQSTEAGKGEAPATPISHPGRLLVRSTPSGASVTVDGVPRGVTPLPLRDLELGTRTVTVAERGYIAEEQRVVLTKARPSRSLEVRLVTAPGRGKPAPAVRRPAPEKPAVPAATAAGSLFVDSRPAGAAVTIDGRPGGVTPLVLDAISPGEHVVTIILKDTTVFDHRARGRGRARSRGSITQRTGAGMKAILALEDGTWFQGVSAGAAGETSGEVVFNTSMTGYQEVLTDPSYAGQIVTMTAPQIGNYGVSSTDEESGKPQVAGFVMRDPSPVSSNWRAQHTLRDYLTTNNIVAIGDIDTRALTRRLRSGGVMRGIIATGPADPMELVERAKGIRRMEGSDLVKDVSCTEAYDFETSLADAVAQASFATPPLRRATKPLKVAAYDYGIKFNILRRLAQHGCTVRVFPASAPASDLLAWQPDGIFLSNGPGDPAAVTYAVRNVKTLIAAGTPMFGICLGHQLMGLALGAKTFKLKFGHRGANHPVKELESGAIEITSQNHGFAVDPNSLPADVRVTHLNLYDGTVEGLRHVDKPIFSVQYHPEASPGPHDADYLFKQFLDEMEKTT